jgi:hypothetical protein
MVSLKKDRLNPAHAFGGRWFNWTARSVDALDAPVDGCICLLIAVAENPKFRGALARICQPLAKQIRDGKLEAAKWDEANAKALAEAVLIGWANLTEDDETTPIPYSPQKAFELLSDPGLFALRQFVSDCSGITKGFQDEAEAIAKGN